MNDGVVDAVAVAASLGGLGALKTILGALPKDFAAAVLVVQHRPEDDHGMLADLLGRHTPLRVKEAEDGETLRNGTVFLAPPGNHLLVNTGGVLSLSRAPKLHHVRPSADPLFKPVATALGPRAIADVPDIAESFGWMLEGLAREVKTAHSGATAVEQARDFRPDLILCDLGMPGMDGYETCRRLRQLPGLEKAVIVAVSGYGGEEFQRKSREAGFDRHLTKPIGRAVLEELVKRAAANE